VIRRALLAAAAAALAVAPAAAAQTADETALAERFAPVVRLVEQEEECGPGEPYTPLDVELLFDEPTVALRGPWNATDLLEVGPSAEDLRGGYEHHLDFPGHALEPGCGYERWSRRLTEGHAPAVYANVATEPARPGKLALQYWLFYAYNDWNNLHEGDWEMIQLVFDADDPGEALAGEPVLVGYSQHEGAEEAEWGDEKLELVDGRPVVYPAAGSHANFYGDALHIGSSAQEGVGCDDTRGPHLELEPQVVTLPGDSAEAAREAPWLAFEGRWGELQQAFYNGPTGPNMKDQWTEPISWSEDWRPRSYAVPTGGALGTGATDFFCTAVGAGSNALVRLKRNPPVTLLLLALVAAVAIWAAARATWTPSAPLRVARRRSWGQTLAASGRMYVEHAPLFLGIGLVLIPLGAVISLVQALVLGGFGLAGVDATGETAGALALLVAAIGATLALLGVVVVQAATARALVELDAGRRIGPLHAYRLALDDLRTLVPALGIAVGVVVLLGATGVLLPVAAWLAVRWSLLAPVVELERPSVPEALRRSGALVRGRWLRVVTLAAAAAAALALGSVLGAVLILVTDAPLPLLNVVAGIFYTLAIPFVALVTAYVYFDGRTRAELDPGRPDELPAEIELRAP
jgi:hypothetical protein